MDRDKPVLARIAQLARAHPSYVAYALAQFQEDESLDDAALAAYLQCEESMLVRLALCGLPRPAPQFVDDVQQIAASTGANPMCLMRLLRTVEARHALRQEVPPRLKIGEYGLPFAAARDRDDVDPDGSRANQDTRHDG